MNVEKWDVLNSYGKSTGRTILRGRAFLKPGEYHLVVHIWIISSYGKILIQRRADDIHIRSGNASKHRFRIRDRVRKAERSFMINAFEHELEIEQNIVFAIRHILNNGNVVALEEVFVELQPVVTL